MNGQAKASADEEDGLELVPVIRLAIRSEAEIVLALLKSSGIAAVFAGRYNPRIPKGELEILVRQRDLAQSQSIIATAAPRGAEPASAEPAGKTAHRQWVLRILLACGLVWLLVGIARSLIYNLSSLTTR